METILFKSISLSSRHFCTAFVISSPRVCPESGSNLSSSFFGPWTIYTLQKEQLVPLQDSSVMSQDSFIASHYEEVSWMSSTWICSIFDYILAVLPCTVLADNDKCLIFFMILALFLKSRNSSSDARMKQSLTYSLSVNGFPFFKISSDTTELARFILFVDCAQLLNMELDGCFVFGALRQIFFVHHLLEIYQQTEYVL